MMASQAVSDAGTGPSSSPPHDFEWHAQVLAGLRSAPANALLLSPDEGGHVGLALLAKLLSPSFEHDWPRRSRLGSDGSLGGTTESTASATGSDMDGSDSSDEEDLLSYGRYGRHRRSPGALKRRKAVHPPLIAGDGLESALDADLEEDDVDDAATETTVTSVGSRGTQSRSSRGAAAGSKPRRGGSNSNSSSSSSSSSSSTNKRGGAGAGKAGGSKGKARSDSTTSSYGGASAAGSGGSRSTDSDNSAEAADGNAARKFTSSFHGVSWHKRSQRWAVQIRNNGKRIHVGYFNDELKAALAYDKVARELRGDRARVNFDAEGGRASTKKRRTRAPPTPVRRRGVNSRSGAPRNSVAAVAAAAVAKARRAEEASANSRNGNGNSNGRGRGSGAGAGAGAGAGIGNGTRGAPVAIPPHVAQPETGAVPGTPGTPTRSAIAAMSRVHISSPVPPSPVRPARTPKQQAAASSRKSPSLAWAAQPRNVFGAAAGIAGVGGSLSMATAAGLGAGAGLGTGFGGSGGILSADLDMDGDNSSSDEPGVAMPPAVHRSPVMRGSRASLLAAAASPPMSPIRKPLKKRYVCQGDDPFSPSRKPKTKRKAVDEYFQQERVTALKNARKSRVSILR